MSIILLVEKLITMEWTWFAYAIRNSNSLQIGKKFNYFTNEISFDISPFLTTLSNLRPSEGISISISSIQDAAVSEPFSDVWCFILIFAV